MMEYAGFARYEKELYGAETHRIFSLGHGIEYHIIKEMQQQFKGFFELKYMQQSLSFASSAASHGFIRNDFGGNPEQANQLVARFLQRDGIDFFTGPIGSNAALAVGPALHFAAKVPYLSANPGPSAYASEESATRTSSRSTRTTPTTRPPARSPTRRGYQNVVLIAPNYPAERTTSTASSACTRAR